jgi:hypothetical protein
MSLCKYKDIFGKLNEGPHSYRIPLINLAFIDVALTILGAYVVSQYYNISFLVMTIFFIIIGIISHKIFCVDSTLNVFIFGKTKVKKIE